MTIEEFEDFILENCYRKIEFPEEKSYNLMKHQKKKDILLLLEVNYRKNTYVTNVKRYYQTFFKN